MENLNFTPRTINEIENEKKRPLAEVLSNYSMQTITLFVKKGLKASNDQEAEDAIAKYLEEGHDTIQLYFAILERLQDQGFLPKALDLKEAKRMMEDPTTFTNGMMNGLGVLGQVTNQ